MKKTAVLICQVLALANVPAAALAQSNDASFLARRDFFAGPNPACVVAADFNGDGHADLVIAGGRVNPTVGFLTVLWGDGSGNFPNRTSINLGTYLSSIAVGDFNGDLVPDLAVTDSSSNSVSVLLGNGDGTFRAPRTYGVGGAPHSVAIGDFNGDGLADLAVANSSSDSVSLLFGNGDGTFQSARTFAAGDTPKSVAVGDFNGDGIPDLVLANSSSNSVSVLLGNGDGTFQTAVDFGAGPSPAFVVVAKLRGGEMPDDLAVASSFSDPSSGISVLLGNGDGTFDTARSFVIGASQTSLVVGDFNGDGIPDLAIAETHVSLLLGNGDGTFQDPRRFGGVSRYASIAAGDFNEDGALDVAVVAFILGPPLWTGRASVLLGSGGGSFQVAPNYSAGGVAVAVGDFNSDGIPDLAAAGSTSVSVLIGNGDGSFQPAAYFPAGDNPRSIVVGKFRGPKMPDDVAVAGLSGTVSVLLGNGDGTFAPELRLDVGAHLTSIALGDFDGDGALDFVVADEGSSSVIVVFGRGDGTFGPPRSFSAGLVPAWVAVGDFDGDGNLDLAVADAGQGSYHVAALLGNGDGTFREAAGGSVNSWGSYFVTVGDFNGDGKPDLAVCAGGTLFTNLPSLSVLLGAGDGSFQLAWELTFPGSGAGGAPSSVAPFRGSVPAAPDDLVAAGTAFDNVLVLLNRGDGRFDEERFGTEYDARFVAVGDFNGDGLPDLAVTNYAGVAVLINTTPR